jgi:pimeloyl-ACP methyl ester carboxylesterase
LQVEEYETGTREEYEADTREVKPSGDSCPDTELPADFINAPARFVDSANEMRLVPTLRAAAQRRNPYEILARSAAAFLSARNPTGGSVPQEDEELGNAFADLAVTGRRAYCLLATPPLTLLDELQVSGAGSHVDLRTAPYTARQLVAKVGQLLAPLVTASPAQSESAINAALDRAFSTAWALRGSLADRTATRAALGWVAVSGEDDMPHRPVNVPAPPYEQYEIPVTVPATGSHPELTLQTRFLIASPAVAAAAPTPHTLRELPPNPQPRVPDGHGVILFLHGHVSGAEEALTLIPLVHLAGLARGVKFAVISVDLPNSGYSESFDDEKIAVSSATQWPSGPIDREPIRTPVLDFIEDFVIAFVDALDQVTPIKDRFSGVIGGSLGGNLGLRLGRRSPMPGWLDKGIVSWNAASVWTPMVNDHIKSQAPGKCQINWQASEAEESRRDYFHEVYDTIMIPVVLPVTQPQVWYRSGWKPCKSLHITGSRLARREVYSTNLRQWHWRVAGEQLIYSHVDRVDRWDDTTPWRYELNVVKHLLIGSALDNFTGSNIFDATRSLAGLMTTTPGTGLFLANTGHSVHFERPRFLAAEIVSFLPSDATPKEVPTEKLSLEVTHVYRQILVYRRRPRYGRIVAVSGTNHTKNEPFSLMVQECVDFIDFGCDVFVARADGGRTAVHVVRKRGLSPYIATAPNASGNDDLLSLPVIS